MRELISNMTIAFKIPAQKYPIKTFLVSNRYIFIPTRNFDKFEETNFNYDNNIFKFQPDNTQIRYF